MNTNKTNNIYKQTPIGLIPSDWEVKRICDGTNYVDYRGKTPQKKDNGILLLTSRNIKQGYIDYECSKEYISELDYTSVMSRGVPEIGDVLFTTEAPMGNVAQIDNPEIALAQRVIKFRGKYKILNNDFLKYYLLSPNFQKLLDDNSTGGTAKGIKGSTLHKLILIIPPLPEQKKIATILSTWDAAIDNCKTIIDKLKQRNKGLSQQLLTGNFKQKKLSDIFERVTTKNTEGNQNVITISAQRGFVRQTDFFNKVIASDILDNYFLVKKGDFCYNKSYSNGYDWGATKRLNDLDKAVVTTLYICFRLKDETKNSGDFFEYYFESGILNKGLSKVANEGGRAHGLLNVTPTDFFNIKVGIPSYNEQIKIAKILSTASFELNQYQQKLAQLKQQKKGLMQQLLTGKTRVK